MTGELLTWTEQAVPEGLTTDLLAVAQSPTAFVAVGTGTLSTGNCPYQIIRSADVGVTWDSSVMDPASKVGAQYYGAIAYGNGRFVAGFGWTQTDDQPRIWMSLDDGVNFIGVVIPNFNGGAQALHFLPAASGPGTFILVPAYIAGGFGADYYTSQDGLLWTARTATWINENRVVDENTTALFHFDFDFRDSVSGVAMTAPPSDPTYPTQANTIGNSTVKFGAGSMTCIGGRTVNSGDITHCMQWPNAGTEAEGEGFNVLGGDCTIEFWFNTNIIGTSGNGPYVVLMALRALDPLTPGIPGFALYTSIDGSGANVLKLGMGTDGTLDSGSTVIATATWYHVAIVRHGTLVSLYINGTLAGSMTVAGGVTWAYGSNHYAEIGGAYTHNADFRCLAGALDEMRVSNIARYTTNFTPVGPFAYVLAEVTARMVDNGTTLTAVAQSGGAELIGVTTTDLINWSAEATLSKYDNLHGPGFDLAYASGVYMLAGVPRHDTGAPQALISSDIIAELGGTDYGADTNLEPAGQTGLTAISGSGLQLVTFNDGSYADSALTDPTSWAYGYTPDIDGNAARAIYGHGVFLVVGHDGYIATAPVTPPVQAPPFDPTGYNCQCFAEFEQHDPNLEELGVLRTRMLLRLGFAAQAANPPPGMAALLTDFLQSSQKLLYRKFNALRLRRLFRWTMSPGVRFYDISENDEDNCGFLLDPYKSIEWVGVQDTKNIWYPLVEGISPQAYTMIENQWRPTRFEIRQCIEVWPAPNDTYYLWIKAEMGLRPFADPTDLTTLDSELVFLHALARAKAHYGKADATATAQDANTYLGNLIAGLHGKRRYIPNTVQLTAVTPPILRGGYEN